MSGVDSNEDEYAYGGLLGTIIKEQRDLLGISRESLSRNLVTGQTLKKIEKGECDSDLWLVTVLLQRLGVSVNRFEMILTSKEYEELLNVEAIEKDLFEGKYEEVVKRIDALEKGTPVKNMLVCRLRAMAEFYAKKDHEKALKWLDKAVQEVTPDFDPMNAEGEYLSVVELENLLAVEKLRFLDGKADSKWEQRIVRYMSFILKRSSDEDDTALLYAKCCWLYASRLLEKGNASGAIGVANKALKRLTGRGFWDFAEPLLKLINEAYSVKSNGKEVNFMTECYKAMSYIRQDVCGDGYPMDRFLENSAYRNISLDYETFKDTRLSKGMTQEELAEGIFESSKPISLMESGKGSVNRSNFGKLMSKLGVNRRRVNPMVLEDSYEIICLNHDADVEISRGNFEKGYKILKKIMSKIGKEAFEKDNYLCSSMLITNYGLDFAPKDEILNRLKKLSEDAVNWE
nr:helix-turn-helix domain-containing protein [Lachnospiraceae bacterium]